MSFESGTMGLRIMFLMGELPEDALARFAAHAAGGLDGVTEQVSTGWVTGRHLLDRAITEETAFYAGFLRLSLRLSWREVPASLMAAECRMEELAAAAAKGQPFVSRQDRIEIRKAVFERLLPQQAPRIEGIPLVYPPGDDVLYAGALSDRHWGILVDRFRRTTGVTLEPADSYSIARLVSKVDVHDLTPVSFSPEVDDALMEQNAGGDFLTWLWFKAESGRGVVGIPDASNLVVALEGPLTFKHEGNGSHVTVLRNGEPVGSAEAKACLLAGKKLCRCRMAFALGDEIWRCAFDAEAFTIRSLVVPEEQGLDPVSLFQCRMHNLNRFRMILFALYGKFLAERTGAEWRETVKAMRSWSSARPKRA